MDTVDLYSQEDELDRTPLAQEMRRKLALESERLRARLRHELAELRARLAPSPAQLGSSVASVRERLAPLTQQLQTSVSSSTQGLCGQLRLYLQGLEAAEARPEVRLEVRLEVRPEAAGWLSRTLEQSSSGLDDIFTDFQTRTTGVIQHLKETSDADAGLWQTIASRLGQEVSSLRWEARDRLAALKAELAAPGGSAEAAASVRRFCESAALPSLQARVDQLLTGLEDEQHVQDAAGLSPTSSEASAGSLHEDFSVRLSALIQDILHSVQ